MIIPLGHEQTTVRRQPWVTWSIIGLCFAAFLLTQFFVRGAEERMNERFQEVIEYYMERPYLELDDRLKDQVFGVRTSAEQDGYVEFLREAKKDNEPESIIIIQQHQIELDRMTEAAFNTVEEHPYFIWGLIPDDLSLHGFITHQFMHGGWMHILGNMFFLFLAAPFIEDVWGRPLFAGFYLLGGIISALLFAMRYADSDIPLIGASGALAAVMGAFLVRYTTTKIKFFYWFFFFFRGVGTAPAWVMLSLWFFKELFWAQAVDKAMAEGAYNVAHLAHVGGFAFGAAVAFAIKHFDIEKKYLSKAIEEKVTLFDNSALDEALETIREGRADEGLAQLQKIASEQPDNVDAGTALWNMAMELSRPAMAAPVFMGTVQRAIRIGEIEVVDPQFLELASSVPEHPFDPTTALKLSEWLREQERFPEAEEILEAAARSLDTATPAPLMLRLAREGARVRASVTGAFAERALASPELPDEAREELQQLLDRFPPPAAAAQAPQPPAEDRVTDHEAPGLALEGGDEFPADFPAEFPEDFPAEIEEEEMAAEAQEPRALQLMEAQPTRLDGASISVVVKGKERRLPLEQLQAVAVAGIAPTGERSFVVVDLLLDSPLGGERVLRCLRASSTSFDPRRVVGGDKPMAAFREFLRRVVDASGASCLPDPEIMNGAALARYGSVAEYEIDVLEVGL